MYTALPALFALCYTQLKLFFNYKIIIKKLILLQKRQTKQIFTYKTYN